MNLKISEIERRFRTVMSEQCNEKRIAGGDIVYCFAKYRNRCNDYKNEAINWDCPRDCPKIQDDISCDQNCTFINKAWKKFRPIFKD